MEGRGGTQVFDLRLILSILPLSSRRVLLQVFDLRMVRYGVKHRVCDKSRALRVWAAEAAARAMRHEVLVFPCMPAPGAQIIVPGLDIALDNPLVRLGDLASSDLLP